MLGPSTAERAGRGGSMSHLLKHAARHPRTCAALKACMTNTVVASPSTYASTQMLKNGLGKEGSGLSSTITARASEASKRSKRAMNTPVRRGRAEREVEHAGLRQLARARRPMQAGPRRQAHATSHGTHTHRE